MPLSNTCVTVDATTTCTIRYSTTTPDVYADSFLFFTGVILFATGAYLFTKLVKPLI